MPNQSERETMEGKVELPPLDEAAFLCRSDTPKSEGWLRQIIAMREDQLSEALAARQRAEQEVAAKKAAECPQCGYEHSKHGEGLGLSAEVADSYIPCEYCFLKSEVAALQGRIALALMPLTENELDEIWRKTCGNLRPDEIANGVLRDRKRAILNAQEPALPPSEGAKQ